MQDIDKIKKEYKLSKNEYDEMYQNARRIIFRNAKTYENPVAIIIGGQTGAGKGGIDVFSKREFAKNGLDSIVIDVDIYRMLHPKADEIIRKYPTLYTEITGQETSPIAKAILTEAIEKKYNFIFEGTMKNTEVLETMKNMPDCYTKIVRVIATSPKESLLTAFERNEEQINLIGYGRFTNVEVHNTSYDGVANTLKIIEESNVPDRIQVFTRGKDIVSPELVYDSNRNDNECNGAYETLTKYRKINEENMCDSIEERLEKVLNNNREIQDTEEIQRERLRFEMLR